MSAGPVLLLMTLIGRLRTDVPDASCNDDFLKVLVPRRTDGECTLRDEIRPPPAFAVDDGMFDTYSSDRNR